LSGGGHGPVTVAALDGNQPTARRSPPPNALLVRHPPWPRTSVRVHDEPVASPPPPA